MRKIISLLALSAGLAGCGFSKDMWRSSLEAKSDFDVCVDAVDERPLGFAVRRKAALELIEQRKIKCDEKAAKAQLERNRQERMVKPLTDPVHVPICINGVCY
jgi:hypothetical protein